jgi:ketosteroid isomerase-like protein
MFLVTLMAAPLAATEQADVMKVVNQFVDGFNKGDTKSALATCASPAFIIDEFPPYAWQGKAACADWARDFETWSKKEGVTNAVVTLPKPWQVEVSGDRAYVVAPAKITFLQHGKRGGENNSVFTAALQKGKSGWRITGWTWSKR